MTSVILAAVANPPAAPPLVDDEGERVPRHGGRTRIIPDGPYQKRDLPQIVIMSACPAI